MTHKIALVVKCPHCDHSLMDSNYLINNKDSIFLKIALQGGKAGNIRLSSVYGDYHYSCDLQIPEDTIVDFICPHCNVNLKREKIACSSCGAPIVTFNISAGGKVNICSRNGCKKHYVLFDDIDTELRRFYEEYDYY